MRVLTLNGGSSSLKVALFERVERAVTLRRIAAGNVGRIGLEAGPKDHRAALTDALALLEPHGGLAEVSAVGHRIVHGGAAFEGPRRVDEGVLSELRRLCALDPDHLPAELAVVDVMATRAPTLPQVVCFDTTFHRTMSPVARVVPIPRRYQAQGVRRYGFHGLSYQYLIEELARVAGESSARGRVILAHLGSGSSLAAVRERRSVDTTMGFTPTSGVPMSTRSGDLDPGVLLHLMRTERLDVAALDELLNKQSGLLGISETTPDMRDLLGREATDPRAAEAIAVFVYQVRKAIGALATTLDGVETLVFSGGIGERSSVVRARIAEGLGHLGVRLDHARNEANAAVISRDAAPCTVRVIATDEESIIAGETLRIVTDQNPERRGQS